jgi:transcriptional regulator GlxA family with amidase domain
MSRIQCFLFLTLCPLLFSQMVVGQAAKPPEKPFEVAILLYKGVELLDFTGPVEVFSSTKGIHVQTFALDDDTILANGVALKPAYRLANLPKADLILLPGGDVGEIYKNTRLIDWLKTEHQRGARLMSVCNGAVILAETGLLDHLSITSHHNAIPYLRKRLPRAKILEKTRFVDNNSILTTGGVSAGIDGALHVVATLKGRQVAEKTAYYMEYHGKW